MTTKTTGLFAATLACGLILAGGVRASAQSALPGVQPHAGKAGKAGKFQGKRQLAKLSQELNLTDSQKAQMKTILKNAGEKRQTIRANAQLSETDRTAQLKDLAKSTHTQIGEILTPEQRATLKADRAAHHNAKRG